MKNSPYICILIKNNKEMDIAQARSFGREFIAKHPQHKAEVNDLFSLMMSEIEEGGSEDHEVNLFIGSCEDLLNEE